MMKLRILSIIILSLCSSVTSGCGVTASVLAADLTQPVMLGKIKRLQGTDNEQWQPKVPFAISTIDRRELGLGQLYAGSRAGAELLKLTELSHDKIEIDEIYVGSYSFLVVGNGVYEEEKSWADIKGGLYHDETK